MYLRGTLLHLQCPVVRPALALSLMKILKYTRASPWAMSILKNNKLLKLVVTAHLIVCPYVEAV